MKSKKAKTGPKPKGELKGSNLTIYEPLKEIKDRGGKPAVRTFLKKAFRKMPVVKK